MAMPFCVLKPLLGLVFNLQKQSAALRRFDPQAIKKGAKLLF